MIHDLRHHEFDRPFSSDDLNSVGRAYLKGASPASVEDNSLVILRDSLLLLIKKYPAHARSISQLAQSIELLMKLEEARYLAG